MKKYLFPVMAGLLTISACGNRQTQKAESPAADSVQVDSIAQEEETTYFPAIHRYLVDSISVQYAEADIHVPLPTVVAVDNQDANDIKVWGEFWVMNYNQVGDTLKMVSGGSHAGLMHISKTEKGFTVTGFDQVGDGSLFEKTAKRIFGDKYENFMAVYSNHEKRNLHHEKLLSEYVKEHGLSATMYQDNGQAAIPLKQIDDDAANGSNRE